MNNIYTDLLLLAAITVYVVDVSGFTDSWRTLVARWLKVQKLRDLPPFDCGKCMTWWTCAVYINGKYSINRMCQWFSNFVSP